MRAVVLSVVGASVSFFAPSVDLRPAVQPAVVLQSPVLGAPQVVATPSARTAGNDDASARWFTYGLFGALLTMAMRSGARAASSAGPRKPRHAARLHALSMSEALAAKEDWLAAIPARLARERMAMTGTDMSEALATTEDWLAAIPARLARERMASTGATGAAATGSDDAAWELARVGIAYRIRTPSSTDAEQAAFPETEISDAMRQLPRVWKKNVDGFWEDAETEEQKRARAMEMLRKAQAKDAKDAKDADDEDERRIRYGLPPLSRTDTPTAAAAAKAKETMYAADEDERRARYGLPPLPRRYTPTAATDTATAVAEAPTATVASSAATKSEFTGVVVPVPTEAPKPKQEKAPKEPKRAAWREGIFAPLVLGAKQAMGEQELKEFRASVIAKHSKVIGQFVDTSESEFGQLVLKRMFEYADKDGNGTLDKEEIRAALLDLGFDFLDEKQVEKLIKNADKDQNDVIDFEEFVKATPKALRINLVKLAKNNGHDLGFLV